MSLLECLQRAAIEEQPGRSEPLTKQETAEYLSTVVEVEEAFNAFAPASATLDPFDDPAEPLHTSFCQPVNLGRIGAHPTVWVQANRQQHRVPESGLILSTMLELSFAVPPPGDMSDRPLPALTGMNSEHLCTATFRFGWDVPMTRKQLESARSFAQVLSSAAARHAEYRLACAGDVIAEEQTEQPTD